MLCAFSLSADVDLKLGVGKGNIRYSLVTTLNLRVIISGLAFSPKYISLWCESGFRILFLARLSHYSGVVPEAITLIFPLPQVVRTMPSIALCIRCGGFKPSGQSAGLGAQHSAADGGAVYSTD